ncbi:Uncharacterised protein [uncultured archaeon]|nr:Uncharacterised protein [uncultured archaeon]
MSNLKTVINNTKILGSTMFIIGALSLSWALKMLVEAMSPPYILKYLTETSLLIYIVSFIILAVTSYKLLSKSYIILAPFLK